LEKIAVRNRFRRGARFIADPRQHSRQIDRNGRVRVYVQAEALERKTKAPGCRCGVLGLTGLRVLHALLFGFMNRTSGLCCPSVAAIQKATGLARSTIFEALSRLEAAGILTRVQRLARKRVDFGGFSRLTTVQATSLYSFGEPSPLAHLLPVRRARSAVSKTARLLKGICAALTMKFATGSAVRPGNHSKAFQEKAANNNSGTMLWRSAA
jgi:hypothetical protein